MSAFLLLGGIACLAFAIPAALGITDLHRLALVALFVSAPLEVYRADAGIGNLSVFRIVLLVAAIIALRGRRAVLGELLHDPIARAGMSLLAVMALSLLAFSQNRDLGFAALAQGMVVLVGALVTASLARDVPIRWILKLVCAGAALPVLAAGTQGLFARAGHPLGLPLVDRLPVPDGLEVTRATALYLGESAVRLKGTFGDPNHFAVWLAFVLAASIALAISSRPRERPVIALAATVWIAGLAIVLLATYSRSGWLAAAVGVSLAVVVAVCSPATRATLRQHRRTALIASVICAALLAPLTPTIANRLDNTRTENRVSNDTHALTTRVAYEEFTAHPLTGIGLSDLGPRLGQDQRTSGAHSSYLTVAAELGLPGLAALLALFVLIARAFLRAAIASPDDLVAYTALFCAYVGFMVANGFYDLLWDDVHWLVVGVALAAAGATPRGGSAAMPPPDSHPVATERRGDDGVVEEDMPSLA